MQNKINCRAIAADIKNKVREEIEKNNLNLTLAVVTFENDEASKVYVKNKSKACEECGIAFKDFVCPIEFETGNVLALIKQLNQESEITGILVQLPLPVHINQEQVLNAIDPNKDVDGLGEHNKSQLYSQKPEEQYLQPCTPAGIMKIFEYEKYDLEGKDVTIIGRSNLVGRPLAELMLQANATVTIAHSKTQSHGAYNVSSAIAWADVVISAIGKPKYIYIDKYETEAKYLIDVGINRDKNNKLCGDFNIILDEESGLPYEGKYTPVPGGVGPLTVAMLMYNILKAHKIKNQGYYRVP